MNILKLDVSSREDAAICTDSSIDGGGPATSFYKCRLQVTHFLSVIRSLIKCDHIDESDLSDGMHSLEAVLSKWDQQLPIARIIHTVNSIAGNEVWPNLIQ